MLYRGFHSLGRKTLLLDGVTASISLTPADTGKIIKITPEIPHRL